MDYSVCSIAFAAKELLVYSAKSNGVVCRNDVGIQWTYSNGTYSYNTTFIDTLRINDYLYYGLAYNDDPPYPWFRKDSNKVYLIVQEINNDSSEYLIYDLSAEDGESWTAECASCDYCGTMTLKREDDFLGIYDENCYLIYRSGYCRDAGRGIEYLEPGIGLVSYGETTFIGQDCYSLVSTNLSTVLSFRENLQIENIFRLTQTFL